VRAASTPSQATGRSRTSRSAELDRSRYLPRAARHADRACRTDGFTRGRFNLSR
jgi:hypothetical protein